MQSTAAVILNNFKRVPPGYFSFKFGDNDEYELALEPLLWENQMYLSLYRDGELLLEKIPIKPGA